MYGLHGQVFYLTLPNLSIYVQTLTTICEQQRGLKESLRPVLSVNSDEKCTVAIFTFNLICIHHLTITSRSSEVGPAAINASFLPLSLRGLV